MKEYLNKYPAKPRGLPLGAFRSMHEAANHQQMKIPSLASKKLALTLRGCLSIIGDHFSQAILPGG